MSLHKIVEYISHLPDVPSTRGNIISVCSVAMVTFCIIGGSARKVAMVTTGEIFNLCTHSTKQIQQYKLSALSSVISVLSCEQFTNKVSINSNNCCLIWFYNNSLYITEYLRNKK